MPPCRTVDVVIGTRPEAIKMAPVVAALKRNGRLNCRVIGTGQHREMFHQVAAEFGFAVDIDLDAMQANQTLAGLTARLMQKIDGWFEQGPPDIALVQGDTTTVLVASLACFYRRIPIGHVEAGLRTGSIRTPFPEELNRRLATQMVALHFAPTRSAQAALLREGVSDDTIEVTGNTVVDALFMELARQQDPCVRASIESALCTAIAPDWAERPFVLVTGHRYVDIWQAVRPAALGLAAWPVVPPGTPWKEGVIAALGSTETPRAFWTRVLGAVGDWTDLETDLIGSVERLIDFVTEPAAG